MFREQVTTVCNWFDRWSPCEQTVAMVAMLRRLHPTQARFLTSVLNRQIADCTELRRTEILANDPNFVSSLNSTESKETLMRDLLTHLPLLNPKNSDVKSLYLALIPKVLKYVLDHCTLVEEARQLLSYSLIHPAFTTEDRGHFSTWLHQFDQLNTTLSTGPTAPNEQAHSSSHYLPSSSPPSNELGTAWQQQSSSSNNNSTNFSGSPGSHGGLSSSSNFGTNYTRIRRSNSLTPPVLHSEAWVSQEELCSVKPRSLSLSSEVSPQSSLASSGSGSETHLDDPRPTFTSPGMKDVPTWLKSLRLHKYAFLFAHITFEEMLGLNEESLEQQGVTKGARHKIILSIAKLRERGNQLKHLSEQMGRDKESLRNTLSELKWMLTTPIKSPYSTDHDEGNSMSKTGEGSTAGGGGTSSSSSSTVGPIGSNRPNADEQPQGSSSGKPDADLTTWIVHIIGKACELNPDPECEGLLVSILDKCLAHDAFSDKQKRVMTLWRQQHASVRRNSVGHPHFHGHSQHHRSSGSPAGSLNGSSKHGRHFSPRVLNINNQMGNSSYSSIHSPWGAPGSSIHAMFMAKRPSLQDQILESARSHLAVQRTKSAPLPNFLAAGLSTSPPITQFDNLNPLGANAAEFLGGLSFPEAASLGLSADALHATISDGGLGGDAGFNTGQGTSGATMSALDITSRLESLCLSMTEAALGLSCTNY